MTAVRGIRNAAANFPAAKCASRLPGLRLGEHLQQPLGCHRAPIARMAVASQPAHVRQQDRLDGSRPPKRPAGQITDPLVRRERLSIVRPDLVIRADINHRPDAVCEPGEEVRDVPNRPRRPGQYSRNGCDTRDITWGSKSISIARSRSSRDSHASALRIVVDQ
ncbi:hypothetical protein QOM21_36510 [Streptomyces sp. Pv4-95]|uniref:hypothetical protein n=1 Tax=Streptomyces sp. Pv4-95 TaxID=3049543 RepID=UPI0038914B67